MSERERQDVPSWDGSSKSWRRYVKEVGWYLSATKAGQRRYVAAKLISRLTGAARLLSMSWHQRDFEGEEGVMVMLRRFSSSPLVRRSLPNAAATMSEYFMFRRRPGEPIAQFLVRETLGFEEFQEALLQLKEEHDGISPAQRLFDLPEITPPSESSVHGDPWRDWHRWRRWEPDAGEGNTDGDRSVPNPPDGYQAVPQTSDAGDDQEPRASPVASPSRRDPWAEALSPTGRTIPPAGQPGVLGPMDSFILDVLRGWRLLVAASLSNDEWRDILASTGNKLDYTSIAEALQTLWDEQLGQQQLQHSKGGHSQVHHGPTHFLTRPGLFRGWSLSSRSPTSWMNPASLRKNLEEWRPSMVEEYTALVMDSEAVHVEPIDREKTDQLKAEAETEGKDFDLVPAKAIFSRKAGSGRHKCRGVACGNFMNAKSTESTFASGASGIEVRMLIKLAAVNQWSLATTSRRHSSMLLLPMNEAQSLYNHQESSRKLRC